MSYFIPTASFGGLELNGKDVGKSWSLLTATANAGATELSLTPADVALWEAGATVYITSSSYNPLETEEKTIAAIDKATGAVTLTSALQYRHRSMW